MRDGVDCQEPCKNMTSLSSAFCPCLPHVKVDVDYFLFVEFLFKARLLIYCQ
uniref:Uncharacterized protein n=1 Tax=Manihot esculenta TaxID=3983 RepID=A0A2C9WLZ8_MANES